MNAAKGIGEALKKHPEFQKALFKDLFTGRMKTEIPPALISMGNGMILAGAQLTVFDCSDNALGPNGMTGLVELFGSKACYSLQVNTLYSSSVYSDSIELRKIVKQKTDCGFVFLTGIEIEQLWAWNRRWKNAVTSFVKLLRC